MILLCTCVSHHLCLLYRREHEAFSEKDLDAYRQLVRVVVRDFLPFVKQIFGNLYSESSVLELATSTPYALRHDGSGRGTMDDDDSLVRSGGGVRASSLTLGMRLDVKELSEVLRGVAPEVMRELEEAERLQYERQQSALLAGDEERSRLAMEAILPDTETTTTGKDENDNATLIEGNNDESLTKESPLPLQVENNGEGDISENGASDSLSAKNIVNH